MGGFDRYAFHIRLDLAFAPFTVAWTDALQRALIAGAPGWTAMSRVSRIGRWTVSERFDAATPGALYAAIHANRPGGARARPILGAAATDAHDTEVVLTGADRGASIHIAFLGSTRSSDGSAIERFEVETTQPTIDGEPAGEWVERLFRALCVELQPRMGSARSLGEAMGETRYGASGVIAWLTFLGRDARTASNVLRLHGVPDIEIDEIGEGLLIRIDPDPGPRRLKRYWTKVKAVEPLIVRPRFDQLKRPPRPTPPAPPLPPTRANRVLHRPDQPVQIVGRRLERVRIGSTSVRDPGAVLEGYEVVRCDFDNVYLGSLGDVEPVRVRNSTIVRCKGSVVGFGLVAFEDCTVEGYAGGFWPTSTVLLRHVTLRGNVEAIDLRWPSSHDLGDRPNLIALHARFYAATDWALDIRDARFKRCTVDGVPAELIVRDPASQILVTKDRIRAVDWQSAVGGHFWRIGIEQLLVSDRASRVFVACPRGDHYEEEIEVIRRLRESGGALPD
jgi:hypothetical protein